MEAKPKKLPLSLQSFEQLVTEGAIYVDKTKYVYELLKLGFGSYFLSRPRRFGKSLLVSTLEAIFRNKKELFKDLWIYDSDYVWQEFPVIKFDMSAINKDTAEQLKIGLVNAVAENAKSYGLDLEKFTPELMFKNLILELKKKYNNQVVILIDEYDSPIIKHINNPVIADQNRSILHDFYNIIKSEGANLRFVFLTGVSKFAKTSIFSGLNNLINISMQEKYSTLLGLTQEELEKYFPEHINSVAEKNSLNLKETLEKIKFWYNGYRFSESKIKVYNPFSTLSLLEAEKFTNYWFETGTPTYLIELIKKDKPDISEYETEIFLTREDLSSYDIASIPLAPVLFDTGYLTIKGYETKYDTDVYSLGYPNFEVKSSFIKILLKDFTLPPNEVESHISKIEKCIKAADIETFIALLKSFFAAIPYELIPKKDLNEKYFQLIFYLLMRVSSFRVNAEERTNIGRIDLVLETNTDIYLFELKVDASAEAALRQIKEKRYYEKYLHIASNKVSENSTTDKTVHLVGINLSLSERNITEWLIERV
jgi:hypothetical protein